MTQEQGLNSSSPSKRKKGARPILLALSAGLILGVLVTSAYFLGRASNNGGPPLEPGMSFGGNSTDAHSAPPEARLEVEVTREVLTSDIEVAGNVLPVREQEFRAPGDGLILSVNIEAGRRVRSGDLLGSLDLSRELYELRLQQFQIDQEAFAGNQRKVDLLQEEARVKEDALAKRRFVARFDGTVTRVGGAVGDWIKTGDLFARVIDTSSLKARVELVEGDVPMVHPGQNVRFAFPALPGVKAEGVVKSVAREGRISDRGVTVLDAELVIPSPPREVVPPFSFVAQIETSAAEAVLVLDAAAVFQEKGVTKVRLYGSPLAIEVEVSPLGPGRVRVIKGLKEGDRVQMGGPGIQG